MKSLSFNLKPVYHGSSCKIQEFNRPKHGVFFTPHKDWATIYGEVVTTCYLTAAKVYVVEDERIIDILFDRNYTLLIPCILDLQKKNYNALQTKTDSEMICAFDTTKIIIKNHYDNTSHFHQTI